MENTNKSLFDISFDENVKQNLKAAATWGGIAAVVTLARSILGMINYFVLRGKISRYNYGGYEGMRVQQTAEATGIVSIVIGLIITIILFTFLNKFSRKTKSGIDANDHSLINVGLGNLSTYFKIIGVLLIIMIVFVGLGMLVGIVQNV